MIDQKSIAANYAKEYSSILNVLDQLAVRKEAVRNAIIGFHQSGVDFKPFKIGISESFHLDYEVCLLEYRKKTGKDAPVRHIPEQIIAAHDEIDYEAFDEVLVKNQIVIGKTTYTVKRITERVKKVNLANHELAAEIQKAAGLLDENELKERIKQDAHNQFFGNSIDFQLDPKDQKILDDGIDKLREIYGEVKSPYLIQKEKERENDGSDQTHQ
jgi:hypothetical protein